MLTSPDILAPHSVINNSRLCEIFKCSPQGGMRRSLSTNTLVIVSNHVTSVYDDRWTGGVFHYTGMGLTGNQVLSGTQNKTLAESSVNGVAVHLLEVFKDGEYTYVGQMKLADEPYQEDQPDGDGRSRKVWMFKLVPVSGDPVVTTPDNLLQLEALKRKKAKRLSLEGLEKRARAARSIPGTRLSTVVVYDRDSNVAEWAKKRANGVCQLCNCKAPFSTTDGEPYLECHHLTWLSKGGTDSLDNTVALCPNCHRKMHLVNSGGDVLVLRNAINSITKPIASSPAMRVNINGGPEDKT